MLKKMQLAMKVSQTMFRASLRVDSGEKDTEKAKRHLHAVFFARTFSTKLQVVCRVNMSHWNYYGVGSRIMLT
jgi:hypothetical protein